MGHSSYVREATQRLELASMGLERKEGRKEDASEMSLSIFFGNRREGIYR